MTLKFYKIMLELIEFIDMFDRDGKFLELAITMLKDMKETK